MLDLKEPDKKIEANPAYLSFYDHLKELIQRLVKAALAILIASCFVYAYIDKILRVVLKPVGTVVFTSPSDAFVARVTLALYMGALIAMPVVLYQVWQFVGTGLKEREKYYIRLYGPLSLFFFFTGAIFAYFVVVPFTVKFLLSFSSDQIKPMITIENYISFVGTMLFSFGVTFELPLILLFLAKLGIATPEFLQQKRRHAIVLILIVSAIMTPPDLISLWVMSGPLIILYEVGIIITRFNYRNKKFR